MKITIQSFNNNRQQLKILNNIIKKKAVLLIRLHLYSIFKFQTFIRPLFPFNHNLRVWRSLNIKKHKCLVYQVLKSPQIHKKSQEKFLFQNYSKIEHCNLHFIYFNKKYRDMIINLFISICLISFSSNVFKIQLTYWHKLII